MGFSTCLRCHTFQDHSWRRKPGALVLRSGLLRCTPSILEYIRNQRSHFHSFLGICVRKKNTWKKVLWYVSQRMWEGGIIRWKGILEWELRNFSEKVFCGSTTICVSVLVFRIFPREYLLQQIHLYSLADLQQVSTSWGHFMSVSSLGTCFLLTVFLVTKFSHHWCSYIDKPR